MDIQEINQSSPEFLYQMLGRLEADCLYYLGNGGRFAGHLWAGNERKQIKYEFHSVIIVDTWKSNENNGG